MNSLEVIAMQNAAIIQGTQKMLTAIER